MSISAIAAVDANFGIGYSNELLFRIPEDMKFFKETTMGHNVIMGRKTYESIGSKPLKNRFNYVITSDRSKFILKDNLRITSLELVKNILTSANDNEDYFIIGGESIYKQLLKYCDTLYLTVYSKSFDNVDSYFPNPIKAGFTQRKIIKADFIDFIPFAITEWNKK